MEKETLENEKCIILHQGKVLNNLLFNSIKEARNWIKMTFSKRRFKEPKENVFVDSRYGTTFKIIILKDIHSVEYS